MSPLPDLSLLCLNKRSVLSRRALSVDGAGERAEYAEEMRKAKDARINMTPQEWERFRKPRQDDLDRTAQSAEYQLYTAAESNGWTTESTLGRLPGTPPDELPIEPNPRARLAKRAWEGQLKVYRKALKSWAEYIAQQIGTEAKTRLDNHQRYSDEEFDELHQRMASLVSYYEQGAA